MDGVQRNDSQHNLKRKKKRSFNQQVKKRFNKFSGGFRVDSGEHDYFMRILELERNFDGTTEEKMVFANNALAQTEGKEVNYSSNQLISRVIENLLPFASNSVLERFFEAFDDKMRPICVNPFAGHVLQYLMILAAEHSQESGEDAESKHQTKCQLWLMKVSRFLLNNIDEFMWDRYSNPILRTAMLCLAGVPHLDKHYKAEKDNKLEDKKALIHLPEEFSNILKDFYTRISTWPQFKSIDFLDNHFPSGYLQALLQATKSAHLRQEYKQLFNKIMYDCFTSSEPQLSTSALSVLEVMISQSKPKPLCKIYKWVLQPRFLYLSSAEVGNRTIQKFLNVCSDTGLLTEIMCLLTPHFSSVDKNVLVSLSQACQKLKTSQSDFFQALTKMLNYDDSVNDEKLLAFSVLSLEPLPHKTNAVPTRNGSLIVQTLLHFQKPIKVVNSLLAYESHELADLLISKYGSFITKDLLNAGLISEKNKQKLIKKLVGFYANLAQSKFGSRSFDNLWAAADDKNRIAIVNDLAPSYSQLMTSPTGQFVVSKVFLADFKKLGAEEWAKRIKSKKSAKKLFAPIIGDVK